MDIMEALYESVAIVHGEATAERLRANPSRRRYSEDAPCEETAWENRMLARHGEIPPR